MNSERRRARGARVRGGRGQGRGVRTRGGGRNVDVSRDREEAVVHLPDVEVPLVLPAEMPARGRGVRGRRGRGDGGRRISTRGQSTRPTAIEEMNIINIESLPRGMPLEKALHTRKSRAWDPANPSPAPGAVVYEPLLEAQEEAEEPEEEIAMSPAFPPSPALFLECGGSVGTSPARSPVAHRSPRLKPRRPLRDIDIEEHLNYGSESGCSDSEEEDLTPMLVSRVYQGVMDTPLDEDDEVILPAAPPMNEDDEVELPAAPPVNVPPTVALAIDLEGAVRPNDFFSFEWRQFPDPPIPPNERREPFSQAAVGPTEPSQDPYTIFVSIWDAEIMGQIVSETNRYAQDIVLQRLHHYSLGHRSRICNWKDMCIDELYTYFAILLAMGIVVKTKIEEYWTINSNSEIFSTPGFHAHMSLSRFQLLNACLHFNNNGDMRGRELSSAEAKLFKIEPIITHLNAKFQSMYTMDRNIALDESLMQWKGWLSINQFITNKAAKVGVKTYELCESQTGYLWRFDVHAKKYTPQNQPTPLDASTPTIVLDLLRGLEGKGYTVWMDNFYNSPALARMLKVLGFDVVGTLRTNRQFVPQQLMDLTKSNMQKGQITGFTSGDVDLMVWRDENRVATISTYHGNQTGVCDGRVKPNLILDYNIMMGGVDKKDQLLSMYPIERKRTKVWYKKLFRRLINISVLNSFIICKKSGSSVPHRNFRKTLIRSLLSRHSTPKRLPPLVDTTTAFLAKTHYLKEHPIGSNKSRLRRRCCVCKQLTHFYCAGCEKAVCILFCFVNLHS